MIGLDDEDHLARRFDAVGHSIGRTETRDITHEEVPVGFGFEHDLAPGPHDVDFVTRLGTARPHAAGPVVGGRDPEGELISRFVHGVHAVAAPYQFAGRIGELHHHVVTGHPT